MKRIMIFLTALILTLSSCKFAQGLNDSLGLVPPEKSEIKIEGFHVFANTDKNDERSFFFPLSSALESLEISWDFLSENDDFVSWYNSLEKSGYAKAGISSSPNETWISTEALLYRRVQDLYVVWTPEVTSVTVHADSNNSKKVYFPSGQPLIQLTWNMLERNDDFMAWYKALSDPEKGIYTKGLSRQASSENTEEVYTEIRQYCSSNYGCSITVGDKDLYVVYDKNPMLYSPDMYLNLWTDEKLYLKSGETLQANYDIGFYWSEDSEGNTNSKDLCSIIESVSFSSSDESVATVDSHGLITGVRTGFATITFTAKAYSGKKYSAYSTVQVETNPSFESYREFQNDIYDYGISDDGKIQICIQSGHLCISENYGKNWMRKSMAVLDSASIEKAKVSHSGKCIVAVKSESEYVQDGYGLYYENYHVIYLSRDYGKNFSPVGRIREYPESIAVSDDGNTIVLIARNENGSSESENIRSVKTFRNQSPEPTYERSIKCLNDYYRIYMGLEISSSGKNILIMTDEGLLYSDDYGSDYTNISFDIYERAKMSSDGNIVLFAKRYDKYGKYTFYDGIHKYENGTFDVLDTDDYAMCEFWASPDCKCIFYKANEMFYYSTNRGYSWQTIDQSLIKLGSDWQFYSTNNMEDIYFAYRNIIYHWKR